MKKYAALCICIVFFSPIFSLSPRIESLRVVNYSSQSIIVEIEFNAGVAVQEKNYFLEQPLRDFTLMVKDRLRNYNVILPSDSSCLHECFPLDFLSGNRYEEMLALPFMEKITAIYKKLTILKEDGTVVVTLDTLGDRMVKKAVSYGQTAYYIEVFDDDLVGKPASEW